MTVSFPVLEHRFREYVATYFDGDAVHDFHISLKLDHSLRVYELARRIVASEKLSAEIADISLISALFHDVGRFAQYLRFRSFHDPSTANHARLGIGVLLENGLLHGLDNNVRRNVLGAVYLHNVRLLPSPLREPLATAVKVVRDSDKLDIVPVVLEHLDASVPGSSVVTLGLEPHPEHYTLSVYEQVLARGTAKYQEMRWSNDFRLLVLGWLYDLNFPSSFNIFQERGYVDILFSGLPKDTPMLRLRRQIDQDLALRGASPVTCSPDESGLDQDATPE